MRKPYRYLVNLEPERVRQIARMLKKITRRCAELGCNRYHGRSQQGTFDKAMEMSENLFSCADAAEAILKADLKHGGD